jgi:hypothetical protein
MELPLKASEAAAMADVLYQQSEGKTLTDELRSQIAGRIDALGLSSIRAFPRSLQHEPTHLSTFYLAVDALGQAVRRPMLLHITPASSPGSIRFSQAVLIGRMRPAGGREVIVHAIPFDSTDYENIRTFADQVDPSFLPRPQGARSAIAAGNRHPEISLPGVFDAFRAILNDTGLNLASTVQLSATREMTTDAAIAARDGENPTAAGHTRVSIRHLYHAGLWAAVRAGWRGGYNAEADHFIVTGNTPEEIRASVEAAKQAICDAAGYTKFTTDTSRLFELRADQRHPEPWPDSAVEERFVAILNTDERKWVLHEFSRPFDCEHTRYEFSRDEIVRLAVKFGESLKLNEELYDYIAVKAGAPFDFEPSLDEAETLTTAKELIFYMHWLQARGRAAQLVPPNLGFKKRQAYPETEEALAKYSHHKMWPELAERVAQHRGKPLEELGARVAELADVARRFDGTLSIHSGSGKQAAVLEQIGAATGGRFNYKISGELQLQLFDVLSEQPAGSYWRSVFDRMVERCNRFAASGAFGAESELAAQYPGSSLGNAAAGRVDGNLFLVFWLGNVVGSRDLNSPDGDHRFFKEKLDEIPEPLLEEVQRRNAAYIIWLARHLRG